jgi:hypothetical protein
MNIRTVDRPNVVFPPPIAWGLAIIVGLGAGWIYPLHFVPTSVPRTWVGGGAFGLGLALAIWAMVTIRKAGTQFDIYRPTTAIVENGPYRLTRMRRRRSKTAITAMRSVSCGRTFAIPGAMLEGGCPAQSCLRCRLNETVGSRSVPVG